MDETSEINNGQIPATEIPSKRNLSSIDSHGPSPSNLERATSSTTKIARTTLAELHLPKLLPNECEIVVDMFPLMREVDEMEMTDGYYSRVEKSSDPVSVGGFTSRLVVFLTRSTGGRDAHAYELGLFLRVDPPEEAQEGDKWLYPSVPFMVMLVNAENPFSDASEVHLDTCDFHSRDPCRGWSSLVSFDSIEDLEAKGFLLPSPSGPKSLVVARSQVCFDGSVSHGGTRSKASPYRGLENQGATCYLNGLLQSMFHLGKLRDIIYSVDPDMQTDEPNVLSALQQVFFDLEANPLRTAAASSEPLTKAFGWSQIDVGIQQDVQEMNRLLIDRLEARLRPLNKDSELKSLFCGRIENYIRCTDIEFESKREEEFYDVQLNLVRDIGSEDRIESVEEALEQFLKVEILEGQNAYDAGSEHGGKQRAEKGVRFIELPPVLTFQLMRFQFDFETLDMRKLNSRFRFNDTIDMAPFLGQSAADSSTRYRLYSVLVHAGGVHGGHYYAFIRPEKSSGDWHRFDDSVVEPVDRFTAIDSNYGGAPPLYNYLTDKTPSEKNFSAYMLMYVRETWIDDILKPVKLEDVNPDLAELIRLELREQEQPVTVKVIRGDSENILSKPIVHVSDISEDWFVDPLGTTLPGSCSLKEAVSRLPLSELIKSSLLFAIVSVENRIRFIDIDVSDPETAELRIDVIRSKLGLGTDDPVVLFAAEPPRSFTNGGEEDFGFILVKFDPKDESGHVLQYTGIEYADPEKNLQECLDSHAKQFVGENEAVQLWFQGPNGKLDKYPVSPDQIKDGMIVVYGRSSDDALGYFDEFINSIDVKVIFHRADRPLVLNGPPSEEGDRAVSIASFDRRKRMSDLMQLLVREKADRLVMFSDDPLKHKDGIDIFHPNETLEQCVGKGSGPHLVHCVELLEPPPIDTSQARWDRLRPVCVRFFNPKVVEEKSRVIYVRTGETVGNIIRQAKAALSIPDHIRIRMVDVDVYECEIAEVYSEESTVPISSLLSWGSHNIFMHSLRIEPESHSANSLKCFHLDRSSREPFGHPFVLDLDGENDAEDTNRLREAVARKLGVTLEQANEWKLSACDGTLMIQHRKNPMTPHATPREKALLIKG